MFGLGMPELIMIMGVTFLVFGGKKLPELGAGLGKGIKAFKIGLRDVESGSGSAADGQEVAAITSPGNDLSRIGSPK